MHPQQEQQTQAEVEPWNAGTFWILAGLGLPIMLVAWNWFGFNELEVMTEQGKAEAAGTSVASMSLWGTVPLVGAHLLGIAALITLGLVGFRPRWKACVWAVAAVAVVSLVSLMLTQLFWGGLLFEMGVDGTGGYRP